MIGGSSNGRTTDSDSVYRGSSPRPPAITISHLAFHIKMTSAATAHQLPCKICAHTSQFFGDCDFNRISSQTKKTFGQPTSAGKVNYFRCSNCGFIFTNFFDAWTTQQFAEHIYNDDYLSIDTEYAEIRPTINAEVIGSLLGQHKDKITLLDYGGGNGRFAEILRQAGFQASTYDKFSEFSDRPTKTFNFLTCFEVMEHTCFPREGVQDLASLIDAKGTLIFSTLLQPDNIQDLGIDWWYIGPRNGHVSLFSKKSLQLLFELHGFSYNSVTDILHMATRNPSLMPASTQRITS
jgi:hypothetical protein